MNEKNLEPETQKLPLQPAGEFTNLLSTKRLMGLSKAALEGQWGYAVAATLIVFLIPFIIQLIPIVGSIAQFILMGPLTVGVSAAYLLLLRRKKWDWEILLFGFDHVIDNMMAYVMFAFAQLAALAIPILFALVFGLAIIAKGGSVNANFAEGIKELFTNPGDHIGPVTGLLLLLSIAALPGSWLIIRLRPFFYILADEGTKKPGAAFQRCFQLTQGQFWRIAQLDLYFALLCLLGLLTLGIAWLFLLPWWGVAMSALYVELKALHPKDLTQARANTLV